MRDFGEWLRAERLKRGEDVRTFAHRAGLDASTISRIENSRTQITLLSVVRICAGLGYTLEALSKVLEYKPIQLQRNVFQHPEQSPVLTQQDTIEYIEGLKADPTTALQLLADLINMLPRQKTYSVTNQISAFSPSHFNLFLAPPKVMRVTLEYPTDILPKELLRTFQYGGVINLMDVGAFLRGLRHEKEATLIKFKDISKRSASVLGKIELGIIEKIKFEDVLELDGQLVKGGEIIALFWNAILLNTKIADFQVEPELINLFVVTCRCLQTKWNERSEPDLLPDFWLRYLRESLMQQHKRRQNQIQHL